MHLHLLLYLFSLLFVAVLPEDLISSASDVRSLLEFKKGIHSDPSGRVFSSWDRSSIGSNGCPSSWHGIVCDEASASVSAIVLDGLGLVGDLKFSTLNGLKMLRNLSLSGNSFTGRLVPAIGTVTSLQHLDLSGNQFYGPIPARIMELWGLGYLNLSLNNFTGWIPSGIQNLQQLKFLDLHSNGIAGDVGILLSELRNTEYVDISGNHFNGRLSLDPQNISSLVNTVRYLNLSHNGLDGEFFKDGSMQMFRNLEVLDVSQNQIRGQLPSFDPLPSLRVLWVGNNLLDGSIPPELFGSSMQLEELDLSSNGFSGSIHIINSTSLKLLNLSSNALSGSLPSTLGGCTIVDLSRNMIDGDISAMQSWGDILEVIDLSSNALSGSFTNATSQFGSLISIKIRNNSLAGVLPDVIGISPKLTSIDLSLNKLQGPIPSSFFTSLTLTNLDLSGNHLTGKIPLQRSESIESLSQTSHSHMESLDLSSNSLTGALPPEIGNMERLKFLNLGKNLLSGHIPSEISKLSGLEYLDLSSNNFTGKIPNGLSPSLKVFNVSLNNLSGLIPENLRTFPSTSFRPGNDLLSFPDGIPLLQSGSNGSGMYNGGKHHPSRSSFKVVIIVGTVAAIMMIVFVLLAYYRTQLQELHGRNGFCSHNTEGDVKLRRFTRPNIFSFHKNTGPAPISLRFSNDQLLPSDARSSMPRQKEYVTEIAEPGLPKAKEAGPDNGLSTMGLKSSPGSPMSSSPHFIESVVSEQPVVLSVYSPDRLAGELFFLDSSLVFTAEELSRAPAEVLGRSSHGTSYKATLDSGHMLTVKWLRVGLVKRKKEFAKEVKRIGTIRHPNIVSLRGYYWGPREQERLILADYINGDSLALHLYETTPRRYSPLSFSQRLKIAIDVARCLYYLHHDRGLPHGNLKPTNILLDGPDLTARLTDYGLHRLMTPSGTAEQILNLGALGYRAPELATASKPFPSFKADVYAFGVILMELLTRRSAGDIISGQSGAVDLTDWVRLCADEGRGIDCFDRDIAGVEEAPKAMDEVLAISLGCILPVNERPNIRTVFENLCSITV
ncbi:probable inactive receptor kinase At5g10020 [Magnolia sinica]|uniref:probable inactive receptor kinase At5g10020 n=1 Tax=Magnolia sinica TaxID=86752 RepID=UPI002659F52B|nr:probable inactive receptor kinase At5g10020 [Magnolia sinica]